MKNVFVFLCLFVMSAEVFSQETQQDSTKVEKLDEVLVKAVRVNATSPITHSNVTKKDLEARNLGQDIPYSFKLFTFGRNHKRCRGRSGLYRHSCSWC